MDQDSPRQDGRTVIGIRDAELRNSSSGLLLSSLCLQLCGDQHFYYLHQMSTQCVTKKATGYKVEEQAYAINVWSPVSIHYSVVNWCLL